jgi:hypothetical protein
MYGGAGCSSPDAPDELHVRALGVQLLRAPQRRQHVLAKPCAQHTEYGGFP